jgi:flagellar biosynthesis protein FlhB
MSRQSGSERTEKPTQKRKEKAREEGQVARSNELNIAFSVIMLFAVLYIVWDRFVDSASSMVGKYPLLRLFGRHVRLSEQDNGHERL